MSIQAGRITPGIYKGDEILFIDSITISGKRNGLIYEIRNKSDCDEFGPVTVTPFTVTPA